MVCVSASSELVPFQNLQLYFRQELVCNLDRSTYCANVHNVCALVGVSLSEFEDYVLLNIYSICGIILILHFFKSEN